MLPRTLLILLPAIALHSAPLSAQSLRGSSASLDRQNAVARQHDFTYLRNEHQVRRFVNGGFLVPVKGNADYRLHGVSFPYARPEVKLFIERLSRQYRVACDEELVVTSLTRPSSHQPANASDRSVHPTGMAVDLRRSSNGRCRAWLERTLLQLERSGVIEATLERWPPHYHIAVFPKPYRQYVASLQQRAAGNGSRYVVRPGDSLWILARRHGTTVEAIRSLNRLKDDRIRPGQVLRFPGESTRYVVRPGDNLWVLARKRGTTVETLVSLNRLDDPTIYPGQVLRLPTED